MNKIKNILNLVQAGCLIIAMVFMIPQILSIVESGFRTPRCNYGVNIFLLLVIFLRNYIGYNKGTRKDIINLRFDILFTLVLSFTLILFHEFNKYRYFYGALFASAGLAVLFLLRKYNLSWWMGSQT